MNEPKNLQDRLDVKCRCYIFKAWISISNSSRKEKGWFNLSLFCIKPELSHLLHTEKKFQDQKFVYYRHTQSTLPTLLKAFCQTGTHLRQRVLFKRLATICFHNVYTTNKKSNCTLCNCLIFNVVPLGLEPRTP